MQVQAFANSGPADDGPIASARIEPRLHVRRVDAQ
jgi:hypothetical protein